MLKIKRITSLFLAIILIISCSMINVSAATVKYTARYKTLNSSIAYSTNQPKTQTFTVSGKNNKKLYIQMHVGYNKELYASAKRSGYTDKNYYYDTIKNKTRFDIVVKDSKGKTIKTYKNVKYGHVTVFNSTKQKYTVTVKSYFSSYNNAYPKDRGASFYAQWSASYYYK